MSMKKMIRFLITITIIQCYIMTNLYFPVYASMSSNSTFQMTSISDKTSTTIKMDDNFSEVYNINNPDYSDNELATLKINMDEEEIIDKTTELEAKAMVSNSDSTIILASETFDTVKFNTVTSPSVSNGLSEPKALKDYVSEEISPYSGELTLRFNDITLPGRNGLDLNIGRIYQTAQSGIGKFTATQLPDEDGVIRNYSMFENSTYYNDRYYLANGWAFNFPSVQIEKEYIPEEIGDTYTYEIEQQLYYHTGNGDVYQVEFTSDETDSNLKDYYKKNIQFNKEDRSFTNGTVTSYYSLTFSDQTKQYFAEDGRLIGIKDRFDNKIIFEHTMKNTANMVPNGNFDYDNDMWKISDIGDLRYVDNKGRFDNTSMKFNKYTSHNSYIFSEFIRVEPDTSYNLSASFWSTYGDDIKIEVYKYDAAYNLRFVSTIDHIQNLPKNTWEDKDYSFVTASSTRYIAIKISVDGGARELYIDNIILDKPKPLISKITDSIGRTIIFDYGNPLNVDGEIGNIAIKIHTPNNNFTKTLTYTREAVMFKTYLGENEDTRLLYYLKKSNVTGIDAYSMYYYYNGDILDGETHEILHFNVFNKTFKQGDSYVNKPVLSKIIGNNRTYNYTYEKVRKHLGDDGYYDTLRVISRYEGYGYATPEDGYQYVHYQGEENKITYSYSGTYNGSTFDNETGYPEFYFDDESNLNEEYRCEQMYHMDLENSSNNLRKTSYFSNAKLQKEETQSLKNAEKHISHYTYHDTFKNSLTQIKNEVIYNNQTNITYTEFTFNDWGGIETQTLPIDEDIRNNSTLKAKYTINYTYDPNYKFIHTKTYYTNKDKPAVTDTTNYDSLGRIKNTINAAGEKTEYFYEDDEHKGNVTKIKQDDPAGLHNIIGGDRVLEFAYCPYNIFVATETEKYNDGKTSTTKYYYDYIFGKLLRQENPDGGIIEYEYDIMGRPYKTFSQYYIGENGERYFLYDVYGYISAAGVSNYKGDMVYAFERESIQRTFVKEGTKTAYIYDQVFNYYDGTGKLTINQRKDLDRPIPNTDGNFYSVWTYYWYDSYGRLEKTKDDLDGIMQYAYDAFDRLTEVTDLKGSQYIFEYNPVTRTNLAYFKPVTNPEIHENHYVEQYDIWGRTISKKAYPEGFTDINSNAVEQRYEYDILGNVIKITDPKLNQTNYEYDELGRLTKTILPDNSSTETRYNKFSTPNFQKQYDQQGNVVSGQVTIVDERGCPTINIYRSAGKLEQATSSTNDTMCRVTRFRDKDGKIFEYAYDELSHITQMKSGNSEINFEYNHFGVLNCKPNNLNTSAVSISYNKLGRIKTRTQDNFTTTYQYETIGLLKNMTDPFHLSIDYNYDNGQRLETIEGDHKTYTYNYYDDGMLRSITYPETLCGVLKTEYTYDNMNRVKTIVTKIGNNIINNLSYTYDHNGNVLTETRNSVTTTYTYDNLNRLKTAEYGDGNIITYYYDARGNREREIDTLGNEKIYSYDDNNRLTSVTLNGNIVDQYTYNDAGAVITHNSTSYTYDEWNNLQSFTDVQGTIIYYKYDHDGIRTKKNNIQYITNLQGQVIAETDENGNVTAQIINGHKPLSRKTNGQWYYYIYNAHGDVIGMVDGNGNVVNEYTYDAWGNILNENETIPNPIRYCGEYFDKETETYYLRARYYSPGIGRFTQEDPARDGLNWYTYCSNSPVMFVDPLGLEYIVVSGGNYGESKGYKYNFIEPALRKLIDLRAANSDETITWMIADQGWTDDDWANFNDAVSGMNINIVKISNTDDFINYINNKDGGDSRANDKITKFAVFSHGRNQDTLALGFDYVNYNTHLDFTKGDISKISASAFDNPNSWFYSCYHAIGGDSSFAATWHKQVNGNLTGAYEGQTTYAYIMYPREYNYKLLPWIWGDYRQQVINARAKYGFSRNGSNWYPSAASGVNQVSWSR